MKVFNQFLLEMIWVKLSQTLIKRNNLYIIIGKVNWVFPTLKKFNNLLFSKLNRSICLFNNGLPRYTSLIILSTHNFSYCDTFTKNRYWMSSTKGCHLQLNISLFSVPKRKSSLNIHLVEKFCSSNSKNNSRC